MASSGFQPGLDAQDKVDPAANKVRRYRDENGILTQKEQLFADAYLRHGETMRAYLDAGYSERSARCNAYKIIKRPKVAAYIQLKQKEMREANMLTVQRVVDRLKSIAETCESEGRWADAIKAWNLLGKHLGMFTERVNIQAEIEASLSGKDVDAEITRLISAMKEGDGGNGETS